MPYSRKWVPQMVLLLSFMLMAAWAAEAQQREITVTGEGQVRVVPDEVIITAGVETRNAKLALATKENDDKIKSVFTALKPLGLDPKLLQTDFMHAEPIWRHGHEGEQFVGYVVRKTLVVTLKDIQKFDPVLAAVLEHGTTHLHGVRFRTTELRKYRDQARDLAIKAAREKAEAMVKDLNQKLGKPVTIDEQPSGWSSSYQPYRFHDYGATVAPQAQSIQNVRAVDENASLGETIAPGQIGVDARVRVKFQIED